MSDSFSLLSAKLTYFNQNDSRQKKICLVPWLLNGITHSWNNFCVSIKIFQETLRVLSMVLQVTDDIRALQTDCIAELRLKEYYKSLIFTNDAESMYVPEERFFKSQINLASQTLFWDFQKTFCSVHLLQHHRIIHNIYIWGYSNCHSLDIHWMLLFHPPFSFYLWIRKSWKYCFTKISRIQGHGLVF